jgi:ribosome assembly protein 4
VAREKMDTSTNMEDEQADTRRILAQFKSEDGKIVGTPFDLPSDVSRESLGLLCNAVMENVCPLS